MKMIFVSGPVENKRYGIDGDITIGRDPSNSIVIPDSAVSLVHCQIYFRDDGVFVKDLGSTNGTYVNGNRVVASQLRDGDAFEVGGSRARIEVPEKDYATEISPTQVGHDSDSAHSVEAGERLSGDIFGKVAYFLKRRISEGGMGAVYEAEQLGADGFIKKVAIKVILPKYVEKESFVSSFIGEAKLVANLVHQNIVQIHHFGRHENGYYIAMEYIDGTNLTDFMNRHRKLGLDIPMEIATFIASRVCRGLEYAHSKADEEGKPLGLVHRDVSPNNIMIAREGEVKLADFGVAKAAQFMEEEEGDLVGSVEYMSPEQAGERA
ncbi:MAG: FHA domain-containing serine/threonine-protein kinase [Kiritimatiellia bacterium]